MAPVPISRDHDPAVDELESDDPLRRAGAADYLPKPFNPVLLRARIGACLEKKRLHDRLLEWSRTLEERSREGRRGRALGRLKRSSAHLAELIVAGGAEDRRPTAGRSRWSSWTSGVRPSPRRPNPRRSWASRVPRRHGSYLDTTTLERFTGRTTIFFNDPVPVPKPAQRAIRMAIAMRDQVGHLSAWMAQARALPRAGRRHRRGLRDDRRHRVEALDHAPSGR